MIKPVQKKIDGILLLDKPLHLTSNAALQKVKRLFNAKKAGHTGSLDPLATGMLPICFGEATKFSQYLLESDKEYIVEMTLGVKTTTADAEGEVIQVKPVVDMSAERIRAALPNFSGAIAQIPPMFSAIKYQGKPLYELARQGISIERQARTVQIYKFELISYADDKACLLVQCSKGTYIRTLIEDLGELLDCGAHVSELRRTAVIPYQNHKMHTLAELEEIAANTSVNALTELLLPLESSIGDLPAVKLSSSASFYMRTGQPVRVPHVPTEGLLRVYGEDGKFMGVGEILEDGRVAPRRLAILNQKTVKTDGEAVSV
jgi:tRNA pseudouridine55 synthase